MPTSTPISEAIFAQPQPRRRYPVGEGRFGWLFTRSRLSSSLASFSCCWGFLALCERE
jgi:hypothetical protein